ncbi:MAG: ribonuclease J [Actinobacteria bacterium]|nr:ribonuclease J [Actinomycetota bacterium]
MTKKSSLRIIFLGGLNEVGRNMTIFEKDNNIVVIDCGVMFPDDYLPGIDFLIPDFSFLKSNESKIKAIIMTHGHEDHIGALPYLFKEIKSSTVPIYATKLTLGLLKSKLEENFGSLDFFYNEINTDKKLIIGPFEFEFFRVNHSIPDNIGLIIRTDIGTIVHSGDFKFDQYPVDGVATEFSKISKAGQEKVLALLCDSTNAEEEGFSLPEREVGKTLYEKFIQADKRIVVATFSSHIHRIQQVFDTAKSLDKKVAITGKTMLKTVRIASELGFLKIPLETIIPITKIDEFPIKKIVLLSTGTQGEPLSALRKMAMGEHPRVKIMKGDMVIISASPIPGNENAVSSTINLLLKQGADVFYESIAGVHVSGHAQREEIKMLINLVKPKYFIPIHGEYKHRKQNAKLAQSIGIIESNIVIAQNGDVIKLNDNTCRISKNLNLQNIYIDGSGSGNTEDIVLKDRKNLSRNGIIFMLISINSDDKEIYGSPEFIFKGIIFINNFNEIIEEAKQLVKETIKRCINENLINTPMIESNLSEALEKYFLKKIHIKPIIISKVLDYAAVDLQNRYFVK